MKSRTRIVMIIAVAVTALAALVWWLVFPQSVTVAEAQQREVVETLVATGQISPDEESTLTADVAASTQIVAVEAGDDVESGEILVEFDDSTAQLEVDEARAGVAEARAAVKSIVERGAPAALEDFEQASRDLEAARDDFERAQMLFDEGIAARVEVDEARRAVERAESTLAQARTAYEEAREDGSDYDQAAAALARAEARHQLARRRVDDYTLRAPADATVLSRDVDPGDTVQPGAAVMTLAIDGPLDIRINPDERELAHLQVGQPALASTDAYPDDHFSATVHRIDPAVDPERGTVTARLRIDDPPDYLRTAMTATVDIELDRRQDALVVPRVALRELQSDAPWILVIRDGNARRVNVDIGLQDEQFIELTDGLSPGELAVAEPDVDPGDRIREGDEFDADADDTDPELDEPDSTPDDMPRARQTGGSS